MALHSASLTICLLLTATIPYQCNGFSPSYIATLLARSISSDDHQEITQAAAQAVLKDYLLDNPNHQVDSTSAINSLQNPSVRQLFGAYYESGLCSQPFCQSIYVRYSSAISAIKSANSDVDNLESAIPKAHFDNEQIPEGNNRLLEKRTSIISSIRRESYEEARTETGRALHTLQDFYSHSNWVELGNTEPMEDLGRPGRTLTNLAGDDVETCIDCAEGEEVGTILSIFGGSYAQASHEYNCRDNVVANIRSSRILTTGYYGHNPNAATGSSKPIGKCSHGGIADITSDFNPVGGINKDTQSNMWSPHSHLHNQAAMVAVKATTLFLQDIREEVGDELFAKFLDIDTIRRSIAFVIDTTGSMGDELPEIQDSLPGLQQRLENYESLLGSGTFDYILVPFNDPDPGILHKTTSIPTLIGYIQQLIADGGGDCREPSIGAAIRAARESLEGGVINLYTDAPASDEQRLTELTAILREKKITVNSLLTVGCSRKKRHTSRNKRQTETDIDIYEFLSTVSGGQKLDVTPTDLSSVDSIIFSSFKPSTLTIFQQTGLSDPTGSIHTVEFQVDSTITEFQITINGNSLESITLLTPQGQNALALPQLQVSLSSSFTFVATINVSNSRFYGTWRLTFTSYSSYRVYITADSSLLFGYNLYRGDNNTRSGIRNVKDKVLQGEPLLLVIEIDREQEDASVTTTSILSSNSRVLSSLSLTAAGDGYFYAVIEAPTSFFLIQIAGVDSRGYQFTRISRAGVDTTDVQVTLGPGQSPFQVLRAQENRTLILLLSNLSPFSSNFTLDVASSSNSSGFLFSFEKNTTLENIPLESGETRSLLLTIKAQENTTEANSLSLIVTIYDNDFIERSNYLNIEIIGTSVAPVNRTEIEFYNTGTKVEGVPKYLILLAFLLISAYLY